MTPRSMSPHDSAYLSIPYHLTHFDLHSLPLLASMWQCLLVTLHMYSTSTYNMVLCNSNYTLTWLHMPQHELGYKYVHPHASTHLSKPEFHSFLCVYVARNASTYFFISLQTLTYHYRTASLNIHASTYPFTLLSSLHAFTSLCI